MLNLLVMLKNLHQDFCIANKKKTFLGSVFHMTITLSLRFLYILADLAYCVLLLLLNFKDKAFLNQAINFRILASFTSVRPLSKHVSNIFKGGLISEGILILGQLPTQSAKLLP